MPEDCEFKEECEKAIIGECTHTGWRIQEGCGHRQFAILVWNDAIEAVLALPFADDCVSCISHTQALRMEEVK